METLGCKFGSWLCPSSLCHPEQAVCLLGPGVPDRQGQSLKGLGPLGWSGRGSPQPGADLWPDV